MLVCTLRKKNRCDDIKVAERFTEAVIEWENVLNYVSKQLNSPVVSLLTKAVNYHIFYIKVKSVKNLADYKYYTAKQFINFNKYIVIYKNII